MAAGVWKGPGGQTLLLYVRVCVCCIFWDEKMIQLRHQTEKMNCKMASIIKKKLDVTGKIAKSDIQVSPGPYLKWVFDDCWMEVSRPVSNSALPFHISSEAQTACISVFLCVTTGKTQCIGRLNETIAKAMSILWLSQTNYVVTVHNGCFIMPLYLSGHLY